VAIGATARCSRNCRSRRRPVSIHASAVRVRS
jgi:hypothetical protein